MPTKRAVVLSFYTSLAISAIFSAFYIVWLIEAKSTPVGSAAITSLLTTPSYIPGALALGYSINSCPLHNNLSKILLVSDDVELSEPERLSLESGPFFPSGDSIQGTPHMITQLVGPSKPLKGSNCRRAVPSRTTSGAFGPPSPRSTCGRWWSSPRSSTSIQMPS